eukprot:6018266-Amphidinium_carterae.2
MVSIEQYYSGVEVLAANGKVCFSEQFKSVDAAVKSDRRAKTARAFSLLLYWWVCSIVPVGVHTLTTWLRPTIGKFENGLALSPKERFLSSMSDC